VIWFALPALASAAYYLIAIVAALRKPEQFAWGFAPPISILKPVRGRDPHFYGAIRSHALQEYSEFEILFAVADPDDPALEDIRRLQREFPQRRIRAKVVRTTAPNSKVGLLAAVAADARHPLLLVNDSDIEVEPGYLFDIAAPLADPAVGLVTCLYRGRAESWPAKFEALSISTEFAVSVLTARLLGVGEFALGATMLFRAETLRKIGGFEAIADYLADDYQLGLRINKLGHRIALSPVVVQTDLGAETWDQAWKHQLRWSRTIRVSRTGGYYGYVVTHATVWALVALIAGEPWIAALAVAARMIAGLMTGAGILHDRFTATHFWLIPFRDLFGFAIWLAGAFGREVDWRGRRLTLRPDGRISK